jgi:hypothetical protein
MAGNNRKKTANKSNRKSSKSRTSTKKAAVKKAGTRRSSRNKQVEVEREGFLSENKYELLFIFTSVISIVLLLSNFNLVGPVGRGINSFLFGCIGVITWIFPFYVFFASIFMLANVGNRRVRNKILASAGLLLALGGIFELASYGDLSDIPWKSLYTMSVDNKNGGGFLGGALAKIFNLGLAQVGAYLLLIAIIIMFVIYLTGRLITSAINDRVTETRETIAEYKNEAMLDARAKAEEKLARRKELREIRRAERERIRQARAEEDERLRQEEMDRKRAISEEIIQERIKANIENKKKLEEAAKQEEAKKEEEEAATKEKPADMDKETVDDSPIGEAKVSEKKEAASENQKTTEEAANINKEVEVKEVGETEKSQLSFLIHRANEDKKISEGKEDEFYLKEIKDKFGDGEGLWKPEGEEGKIDEGLDNITEPSGIAESDDKSEPSGIGEPEVKSEDLIDEEDEEVIEDEAENEVDSHRLAKNYYETDESDYEEDIDEYEDLLDDEDEEEAVPQRSILEIEKERLLEKKTITGNKALESSFGDGNGYSAGSMDISNIPEKKENSITDRRDDGIEPLIPDISVENPPEPPKPYVFPPISLLSKAGGDEEGISDEELHETARKLQDTLTAFGVNVKVTDVSCGPSVTRYELQPEQGVKVSKITALTDDIKLNLAAADIRIEAPIPGKAAVGIEVPNKKNLMVYFRDLIENKDFNEHQSKLAFAVGKDIGGQTMISDIAKMPHLLIAGATGSGKSVCINTLIMSILYKAKPSEVKLIMVDPKVVELSVYNGIPHLLLPVVTDPKKAAAALNWAVAEMNRRYKLFSDMKVREIKGFNKKVGKDSPEWMPQIVIIVDELADLMMVSSKEVEEAICRLAQLARAAGIHLVIATQRPSVNVITGLIKANVPSRIAFAVSSQVDSRTILDGAGAEKLLGKGDMLFFPSGYPKPVRVQGAFVSDNEVSDVVEFIKENNDPAHKAADITEQVNAAAQVESIKEGNSSSEEDDGYDEYFEEAGKLIIDKDKASIGMLQRVYRIGFNRAARIMDQLAEVGVVSEEDGTKPRKVLMSKDDFEAFILSRH